MTYFCSQLRRKAQVLAHSFLNGIDSLEVEGAPGCGSDLEVTLLRPVGNYVLRVDQVAITGGAPVHVVSVELPADPASKVVVIHLDGTGDFSTYTLRLSASAGSLDPPDGFDPQMCEITFSFKAGCSSPADCYVPSCCDEQVPASPAINYLAKDYDAFRQNMIDRMSVVMPNWNETHAADLGIGVIETLAYVADRLSYAQDAVSTEAYLDTARSRISLRRLARLVDYHVSEGCNARTWVCVQTGQDGVVLPAATKFYVRTVGVAPVLSPTNPSQTAMLEQLLHMNEPVYESLIELDLYQEQNSMEFYTWGDSGCCLPAGATSATLAENLTTLAVGRVLIFEEKLGPKTGKPEDADAAKRCAVRLTSVRTVDDEGAPLSDPLTGTAITEVSWSAQDALPFSLCISSVLDVEHGGRPVLGVSHALGNVVPADQGVWIEGEDLGMVPNSPETAVTSGCTCGGESDVATKQSRFQPQLVNGPLTFQVPFDNSVAAQTFLSATTNESAALPQIHVVDDAGNVWLPQSDLLSGTDADRVFVIEVERDGSAHLRFGDGEYGMAVDPGVSFTANYRVGNGKTGLVGADALVHVVTELPLLSLRNPLAAAAAVDAETEEHIRQYAPFGFESQLRCVTEQDYADAAMQDARVMAARGTMRWTGSWYAGFVSIEAASSGFGNLAADTLVRLEPLRMMMTGLAVEKAIVVGLRITLAICVNADRFQSDVYAAVMKLFTTGSQCDGTLGLLDPSHFTFGKTVYASPFIAAAQKVDGVSSVRLVKFERMDSPSNTGRLQGYLTMGRLEIARCDNNPNQRNYGIFTLQMEGGR